MSRPSRFPVEFRREALNLVITVLSVAKEAQNDTNPVARSYLR